MRARSKFTPHHSENSHPSRCWVQSLRYASDVILSLLSHTVSHKKPSRKTELGTIIDHHYCTSHDIVFFLGTSTLCRFNSYPCNCRSWTLHLPHNLAFVGNRYDRFFTFAKESPLSSKSDRGVNLLLYPLRCIRHSSTIVRKRWTSYFPISYYHLSLYGLHNVFNGTPLIQNSKRTW